MDKPDLLENLYAYGWIISWSSCGGIASYIGKIKQGKCRFSITELAGEIFISGFVGMLTYFFCHSAGINELLTSAFVGISGHMGSRAIFLFETLLSKKIEKMLSVDLDREEAKAEDEVRAEVKKETLSKPQLD
jgi:hypothetical protein